MTDLPQPAIMCFQDAESYTQDEPGIARFAWLLKLGKVPGICMGLVELEGPIHKTPASHADWDQVYLVMEGSGTIHLAEKSQLVAGPTIIVIPRNTHHSVELKAGEKIKYVFVNEYLPGKG